MPASVDATDTTLLQARRVIAYALAASLADPRSTIAQKRLGNHAPILLDAWDTFCSAAPESGDGELGLGERPVKDASIQSVITWLTTDVADREIIHQHVFGLVISKQCPPFETEYSHWKDPTYRAQQVADIAGFFNAFGVEPNPDSPERQDHVSLELEFMSLMLAKTQIAMDETGDDADQHRAICNESTKAFVEDHVAWWMPTFGRCLEKRIEKVLEDNPDTPLRESLVSLSGVSILLQTWVGAERAWNSVAPNQEVVAPMIDMEPAEMSCAGCGSKLDEDTGPTKLTIKGETP